MENGERGMRNEASEKEAGPISHSAFDMRIAVLANGPFALPSLRALLEPGDRYPVVGLFTRPERPARGRDKQQPAASLMRLALDCGLPVYAPDDINSPDALDKLNGVGADLLVVCDFGQILSQETLSITRFGGINLHGSLLPKYRGRPQFPGQSTTAKKRRALR